MGGLAKSQGSNNWENYYNLITERIYDVVILGGHKEIRDRKKLLKTRSGRECLGIEELYRVGFLEKLIVNKIINEVMTEDIDYHEMYKVIKEKIMSHQGMFENKLIEDTQNKLPI